MKLYYSPGFCSLVPHIVLRELGCEFTLERVAMPAHTTASGGDYYSINPKGYVPLLELDNSVRLTEVAAIVQYLADLKPQTGLAPPAGTMARVRLQEALNFIATELHKGFSPVHRAPPDYKETAIGFLRNRFNYVETLFGDARPFLLGSSFSVADAYLFTVSTWLKFAKLDIADWPKFAAFARRVGERPAVQGALKAEGLQ